MAQVGRISGGLLQNNLLRLGATTGANQNLTFRNVSAASGGAAILHLDVINGKIGINNDAPSTELHVLGTTRIFDPSATGTNGFLTAESNINIADLNIQNSTIQPLGGTNNIIFDSAGVITSTNVKTEELYIDDNYIESINSNSNIELQPNGTGSTEIISNLNVRGDLHSFSDITADGNIVFGDNLPSDTVTIKAEVSSNIIPDVDNVYTLGNTSKRWIQIESVLLNGQETTGDDALISGVNINMRQGKIWFVAKNGSNSNVGDHPQGPFETIDYAVTQASTGDTIYVFPGVYEESCPITIPQGVTLHGHDQRNTIIEPASSQSTTDIFLLNGETALSNFTIRNFYYDNVNDVGYAFRFAPGGKVTSRSPYIQNVTVSTKGSTVTAGDPLGFIAGDAGRGILADGAVLAADTREASLLFHAITLIVPNADALVMTNGVRIEWLNSFTYYANRGFYAINGSGRVDDNLQTHYGAEVRSIGSANIYGNYGAVADGADTLMYLIMHNFGYVGTGSDSSNDDTLTIQANEVVETNNGRIQYQSQSHSGDFRVGDNFLIDFEKGSQTFNINDVPVVGVDTITVTTGSDVSYLDLQYIQTGNLRLIGNSLVSISGDMNIDSASGLINLNGNVNIDQNLDVSGDITIGGTLIRFGNNQNLDVITFESGIDSNLTPKTTDTYNIGSSSLRWDDVWLTQVLNDNINATNNFIETTQSNSNLELRASGTGQILISDSVTLGGNLTVTTGSTEFAGITDVNDNLTLTNFSQVGDLNITGNVSLTESLTVDGSVQFEDVLFSGNVVTTTLTNSDLELRASGTGNLLIPNNNVSITNKLTVSNTFTTGDLTSVSNISAEVFTNNDLTILDNNITAITGDLELSATGNVVFDNAVQIDNNLTVTTGLTTINNNLSVTGLLDHTGNRTQVGNYSQTGNLDVSGIVNLNSQVQLEEILVDDNFITTTSTNANLELRASGTGVVRLETTDVQTNLTATGVDANSLTATTINSATLNTATITIAGNKILSNVGDLILEGFGPNAADASSISVQFNDFIAEQNLSVVALTTNLQALDITGSLTQTGNRSQVGDYNLTGNLSVDGEIDITKSAQFEEILIDDNFITTTSSNANLELRASGTGQIIVPNNNVTITNNLDVNNSVTLNQVQNTTSINTEIFRTDELDISDNTITTTQSNADLTLRANGTGEVYVPSNNVEITNNLTVNGVTDLRITNINGTLTHTGNKTQTGNADITGDMTISGLLNVPNIDFENIDFDENVITTVDSNSDLELRAAGSGKVIVPNNDVEFTQNVNILGNLQVNIINSATTVTADLFNNYDYLHIYDNNILATTLLDPNTDIELSATGNIVSNADNNKFNQNLDVDGTTTIADTNVNGSLTYIGDLTQTGNVIVNGNVAFNGKLTVDRQVQFENVALDDNIITTVDSNSDLELRAVGTGKVLISSSNILAENNFTVQGLTTTNGINNGINITSYSFETDTGLEIRDNIITHTVTNSNISLDGTEVQFNSVTELNQNLTVDVQTNFTNTDIGVVGDENTTILTHTGNRNITGDFNIPTYNFSLSGQTSVTGTGRFGDIKLEQNVIRQTTIPDGNLELRASGTGKVLVPNNNVEITNDLLISGTLTSSNIQNVSNVNADLLETQSLRLYDNNVDAYGTNTDIILDANGTGSVVIDTNDAEFSQNLSATNYTLGGMSINGTITHVGDRTDNGILFLSGGSSELNVIGTLDAGPSTQTLGNLRFGTIGPAEGITAQAGSDIILRSTNNVVFDGDLAFSHNNINVQNITSNTISNSGTITANAFETADITITQNKIESVTTGTDLFFMPTTGNKVHVPSNNVFINQDLNVTGTTTVQDLEVKYGTVDPKQITHVGDRTVNDFTTTGNLTVTGNIVAAEVQFEEININDNTITTTSSSAYLELRANGSGEVQFDANSKIAQNLYLNGVSDITQLTTQYVQTDKLETNDIEIYDNRIQTTNTDSDLELSGAGTGSVDVEDISFNTNTISSTQSITFEVDGNVDVSDAPATKLPSGTTAQKTVNTQGDIRFNNQTGLFEGFTTVPVAFSGIYSADRLTSVDATSTSNQIVFTQQGVQTASIQPDNFFISGIVLPQMYINNSTIGVSQADTDLTFENGTGVFNIEDITIEDSKIINNTNNALEIKNNSSGYYTVLVSNSGVLIPAGPSADRTSVEIGDTRWNTDDQILETFDGNTYIASAGLSNNITPAEFDDLLFEYTLIFG